MLVHLKLGTECDPTRTPETAWLGDTHGGTVPHLNGSAPSECMMAACVRRVAASLYILLHMGQGRGS